MTYPQQPAMRPVSRWKIIVICIAVGLAAMMLGALAKIAYNRITSTTRPAVAPAALDSPSPAAADTGVTACESLRDTPVAQNKEPLTEQRYRELRTQFQDSQDTSIRDNGTKMIDIVWKIGPDQSKASAYMGPLMEAVTGLQAACASHGIVLPSN